MRSSVAIPPVAVRPRLPHPKTVAVVAAQLGLVAALLWFGLPQNLGGRAEWVMVSGTSMLPRLHTGDLVLVERRSSYHVGEVVAYRVPKGQVGAGFVVIHRIVGGDGRTGWRMKGDNRTAPDLWHPRNRDVLGSKALRIPDAWLVLRLLHMPILLGLFAGFGIFFWIALAGEEEPEG
ncbi:MAG TPA: signal peptidase I [Gaiellaceae bacterium]|jgi:signal peptidase